MTLTVPPSTPYADPVFGVPALWSAPLLNPRMYPIECRWNATLPTSVQVNMTQGQATNPCRRIAALTIENRANCEVLFLFPDTNFSFTVPAFESYVTMPVFTEQTTFYVVARTDADGMQAGITRIMIHETIPPPQDLERGSLIQVQSNKFSLTGSNLNTSPVTFDFTSLDNTGGIIIGADVGFNLVSTTAARIGVNLVASGEDGYPATVLWQTVFGIGTSAGSTNGQFLLPAPIAWAGGLSIVYTIGGGGALSDTSNSIVVANVLTRGVPLPT